MILILLRHGHNPWSAQGRYTGTSDIELDETGHGQAQAAARWGVGSGIRIDEIWSSPLRRCMATALYASEALGQSIHVDPRLREINYGHWEGLTSAEIENNFPGEYREWENDPAKVAAGGGESGIEVLQRYLEFVKHRHGDGDGDGDGKSILAVTHRTVMRIAVAHAIGLDLKQYRDRIDQSLCSVNILDIDSAGRGMLKLHNFRPWAQEVGR